MENQPSIHNRDDGTFDGSTVQRAKNQLTAGVGSTASSAPIGAAPSAGAASMEPAASQAVLDDAETVIRRNDSDSAGKIVSTNAHATPAAVAAVLLGTRLNHFLLEEMIGGGGMGAVFRARDDRLDRVVAIKVIPFVGDDPDLQRRFRNEAQNAARLDHPYIARVFDVGQFEQWHYIVFEYVDGINLRDMVARDGVLPIDDAVYYARQIAEAIEHANGRGIVHRDIKPSNVLVGVDGNVKVVDMGLARSQQFEVSGDMTASGVTLGTFDYISPEQARDPRDADVRSDIYSLGCTLYYLLTASPPYPGGTMLQKLLSHGNAPPPDPRGLRPEVSDDLTAIIHKMLAKDPAARYPRAIDVVADFRELAVREGLMRAQSRGTLTITSGDPLPRFMLRHVPWVIAAALVLAVAGWLHSASTLSRNEFAIEIPSPDFALRPEVDPAGPPGDSLAATTAANATARGARTDAPVAPSIQRPGDANQPLPLPPPRDTELDDLAAAPPKFSDVARPPTAANVTNRLESPLPLSTERIERIVVGTASTDPAAQVASTLAEAVKLAEELQVNVIEIASSFIKSPPIQIRQDDLVIRSAVGGSEIQFVNGDTLAMQRVAMIDLGSSRITMQNLHLSWNVRGTTIYGGALFRIANDNPMVRIADSTVTIENLTERDEVFAFEITGEASEASTVPSAEVPLPVDAADSASGSEEIANQSPLLEPANPELRKPKTPAMVAIELNNVSARGEMTLISLVDAAQLQFQWRNGLLAVSRRMLEAVGADVPPTLGIQISLDQVTAWTPEGFARVRLGQSRAYPMLIDRNSIDSVFYCDPSSSHIEFDGLDAAVTDPGQLVQLRGDDNNYDFAASRDSIVLTLGQWNRQAQTYRLEDILAPEKPSWISDRSLQRSVQWVVRWTEPIPATTPSRLTTSDFHQEGTLVPGFDKKVLPSFPIRSISGAEI